MQIFSPTYSWHSLSKDISVKFPFAFCFIIAANFGSLPRNAALQMQHTHTALEMEMGLGMGMGTWQTAKF